MEEIVLDINLKYVLATLDMSERGELLTALFDGTYTGSDTAVKNVYHYISMLQQQAHLKKQHMRELSAKGVAARAQKKLLASNDLSSVQPPVQRRSSRKETKEDINKYNLNLFSFDKKGQNISATKSPEISQTPPTLDQVQQYITAHQLRVDAETFINFYESHGWMVGTTPIKSWQATLKLWHLRATTPNGKNKQSPTADEDYWQALQERLTKQDSSSEHNDILSASISTSARQNLPPALHQEPTVSQGTSSPFARFMHRVEQYDINMEKKHE